MLALKLTEASKPVQFRVNEFEVRLTALENLFKYGIQHTSGKDTQTCPKALANSFVLVSVRKIKCGIVLVFLMP